MNQLVVEKRHNPIMDLSIAYGLLYLLTFNEVKTKLTNHRNAYVITYEDFDIESISLYKLDQFDFNFGKFLNRKNKKKIIEVLFDDIETGERSKLLEEGHLEAIINYYSTDVNERITSELPKELKKTTNMTIIGSWYGGKGQRSNLATSIGYKTNQLERWLSELGFITTASFMSIDDDDFLLWMAIPSKIGVVENKLFEETTKDEESGEYKRRQFTRSDNVETVIAERLLYIQDRMAKLNIINNYDGALFMQGWNNGNTGSADKVKLLDWYPYTEETLEYTMNMLRPFSNDKKIELRYELSKWLLTRTQQSYHNFVQVLAKEGRKIYEIQREDYLIMANIKDLHTNIGIITIGKRLNGLLHEKRGFEVLVDLMDVHSKAQLMEVIGNMSIIHNKVTKGRFNLWNNEEHAEFLKVVNDEAFTAKDITSAILLHSQTYPKKEEVENTETEEESKEFIV